MFSFMSFPISNSMTFGSSLGWNFSAVLANKVAKTKKSVKLEPMNPYERKVIHATLQNHPHVTTKSEGQDPYRRVIIELK